MNSLAQKTVLLTVSLLVITTAAISMVFYNSGKDILIKHAMDDLSDTASQEKLKIQSIIEELKSDTLFLAGTPPIQGMLRAEHNQGYDLEGKSSRQQWEQRLENIFTTLLHAKPHYLQARYIDTSGNELIRVDRHYDQVATVPKDKLQNKSQAAYTKKTLVLKAKELYLSKINLNREYGKITIPHTPVIRSATPIYDTTGNIKGLVIINLNFGKELAYIEKLYKKGNHELLVADNEGHYLVHPDTKKRFGFELGHRYRVHEDHPRLARMFMPDNLEEKTTLIPHNTSQNAMVMVKLPFDARQPESYLALILARPYANIIDEETAIIRDNLWIGLLIMLIGAMVTYIFARQVVKPLQHITSGIEDFRQGKSSWTLPEKSNDEIGILTRAFEDMMSQVSSTQDSLKQLNSELEQEVEARTRDLNHNLKILNAILENLPLMMFMKDAEDLRFVRFNKAGEDLLGMKREEFIGKNDYDFFPKEQADFFTSNDRDVIASGHVLDTPEEPIQTIHGERILHTRKTVIHDDDGKPLYLLGISADITERKKIENSLIDSEKRIRTILDTMVDALITIGDDGLITAFNPAAEKMFGYAVDEVMGKNINMLMPEPYHSLHDQYLKNYATSGNKKVIGIGSEVTGLRKNGDEFPLELAVSETNISGQRLYIGVVRDITERNRIDKMKNEFISTVSHELRTPLTSIRGSLGLINGGAAGEMSERASNLLSIAHKNTERLLLLINDILDLQKIETGNMPFNFNSVTLQDFVTEAIEANKPFAYEQEVSLRLINHLQSNVHIIADHDRLMQVMNNLLSNAAKFSPSTSEITIDISTDNNTATIAIHDQGPGIPEEFRNKLFDKFTQSDSSDTRHVGGTGLGLSISKLIIEKHNGSVTYDTSMGEGTTFYIHLPALTDSSELLEKMVVEHGKDILIIEDDLDIATLLSLQLNNANYQPQIAATAEQAWELLNAQHFDAITLDIALPGQDGISFLKQLRQHPEYYDLPVVVISVKADAARRELNGGAIGIIDWLNKPFNQSELERALSRATKSSKTPEILYVEDDTDLQHIVTEVLTGQAVLSIAPTLSKAKDYLNEKSFDLVLLDVSLPDGCGLELLANLEACTPKPQVVIYSANPVSSDDANRVSAVLLKSQTSNDELIATLKNAIVT